MHILNNLYTLRFRYSFYSEARKTAFVFICIVVYMESEQIATQHVTTEAKYAQS